MSRRDRLIWLFMIPWLVRVEGMRARLVRLGKNDYLDYGFSNIRLGSLQNEPYLL